MKKTEFSEEVFIIEDFFTSEQCFDFIAESEKIGYEEAKVLIDGSEVMFKNIRNNSRILYKNEELAAHLFSLIKPFCPEIIEDNIIVGLNELFRFYKYEQNQRFKKHKDGSFKRNDTEASRLTFMIYLNDNFKGGETSFDDFIIAPRRGTAVVFKHEVKHQGNEILDGVKYVLRTDIMYRKL